jgi:starch synthase
MRVTMIASECEPWAKTGGLGDVVDALARALGHSGADGSPRVDAPVDVFLPRYRSIAVPADAVTTGVRVPDPASSDGASDVDVVSVKADGYRLRLVDLPAAFDRDGYYGTLAGDHPDNAWRFGMLCRSALETMRVEARPVDVVHVHDWQGAPAVLYRDAWYWGDFTLGRTAFVLTLHNPAYHGWTHASDVWTLGLPGGFGDAYGLDILRTGIQRADMVNTVSPTFAREATTPEMGKGLDWALAGRGDRFIGILNGIDTAQWDPATDAALAATYGPGAMAATRWRESSDSIRTPRVPSPARSVVSTRRRASTSSPTRRTRWSPPGRAWSCSARAIPRSRTGSGRPPRPTRTASPSARRSTATWRAGSTPGRTSSSCRRGSSRPGSRR